MLASHVTSAWQGTKTRDRERLLESIKLATQNNEPLERWKIADREQLLPWLAWMA